MKFQNIILDILRVLPKKLIQHIAGSPIVIDGKIEIRPMMYLALSYDHRIVDGREAVTFLVKIKEIIEDPRRLILDL